MSQEAMDPVDRAHLRNPADSSHRIHRHAPSPPLQELIRRYWIPVWDTPTPTTQRVLQYPVCLLVISNSYARLVGPARGVSTKELSGRGWAFGVMLQPAAGTMLLTGQESLTDAPSVQAVVDGHLELSALPAVRELVPEITRLMITDPHSPDGHARAIKAVERTLSTVGPLDAEGLLINDIVEWVEGSPEVQRVGQITERFGVSERSLQRLLLRRIGLTPKWLIARRRLHEVSERLQRGDGVRLADVAADLGYTDQAHLSRDFRTVTGMTPRSFAAQFS
ncbi:helix-turn-helix domain-containing protein [Propionibacteriaceae bacterium Y1700]|uniref:helix-turn-helix domain-containing protein n=1 Tax=Microlunatus sp. Y1700 TaxID=3418487 RepID=UPI003DA746C4